MGALAMGALAMGALAMGLWPWGSGHGALAMGLQQTRDMRLAMGRWGCDGDGAA